MKQILVVDDSAVIRKIARRILDSMRFRTSEANDGRQAVDWLLAHPGEIRSDPRMASPLDKRIFACVRDIVADLDQALKASQE